MDNVERDWDVKMFVPNGLKVTVKAKTEREALAKARNMEMDCYSVAGDLDEISWYATPLEKF